MANLSLPPPATPPARPSNSQKWLVAILAAGLVLVCLFGFRAMRTIRSLRQQHFRPTGEPSVEMVRGWMTIEYISQVYQIPQDYLLEQLNIPNEPANVHKSISQLNREYFPGKRGVLINEVQAILSTYQAAPNPPASPSPLLPTYSPFPLLTPPAPP